MDAVRKGLLVVAALAATALISGTAAAPASAATTWLCKPGTSPNPCYGDLTTTVYPTAGGARTDNDRVANKPKFDCFYVYPTVSEDEGTNSDLSIDPEQIAVAHFQASRFSDVCRVWAPMYRQLTLDAIQDPDVPVSALELAYGDVKAAFAEYMRKHNNGRGVVLIGHSQGTGMLTQLIRGKIDPYKPARRRLISAMLLGGNVLVKQGSGVGGVFQKIPACNKPKRTGCVVAYSTFDETPPDDAAFGKPNSTFADIFGLAGRTDLEVLCTNPAALGGGSAALRTLIPTAPFPGTIGQGITVTFAGPPPTAPTPWVEPRDHYTGACVRENGAHVLKIAPIGNARNLNATPDATWGLHLADVNIALGNLVELARTQGKAYIKQRASAEGEGQVATRGRCTLGVQHSPGGSPSSFVRTTSRGHNEWSLMTERTQLGMHPAKLMQLKMEARNARERLESYRSEVRGEPASSKRRMRDLKQASDYADARLERAKRD